VCTNRVHRAGHLVRAGRNVIAVRVFSNIYQGGFIGAPSQMRLLPAGGAADAPISLAGVWRYAIEANFGLVPPRRRRRRAGNPNSPCMLFDNMLRPLLPYAIPRRDLVPGRIQRRAGPPVPDAVPVMIRSWRDAWQQGTPATGAGRDFQFPVVQLANYQPRNNQPTESAWAELREARR